MKEIIKIKTTGFSKLNNAEYTNFSVRFLTLANAAGYEELGLDTTTDLEEYTKLVGQMNDLVAQSRISNQTAELDRIDKQRDDLVVYLLTVIRNAKSSPLEDEKAAGTLLYNLTKPYIGIQRLPDQQETVQIKGLLLDLAKAEYQEAIAKLNLVSLIESLDDANATYSSLTKERTEGRVNAQMDNSTTVRARMDVLYDYITTMAFVNSVAHPTAKNAQFVTSLNALIDEVITLYNIRMAQKKRQPATNDGKSEL